MQDYIDVAWYRGFISGCITMVCAGTIVYAFFTRNPSEEDMKYVTDARYFL
jgi:hypothetical protein